MLITYLEYFGFVIRVNQKRADDLVTRDIKKAENSVDCRLQIIDYRLQIVDDVQCIGGDSQNSENNMSCIV